MVKINIGWMTSHALFDTVNMKQGFRSLISQNLPGKVFYTFAASVIK
jgi:hypothetical protein